MNIAYKLSIGVVDVITSRKIEVKMYNNAWSITSSVGKMFGHGLCEGFSSSMRRDKDRSGWRL